MMVNLRQKAYVAPCKESKVRKKVHFASKSGAKKAKGWGGIIGHDGEGFQN
jgi:hypothetical protein